MSETAILTTEEEALLQSVIDEVHQDAPLIPVNSATINRDDTTSRFSSAVWYDNIRNQNVVVAGVGGIGSWTALLLGRLKPNNLCISDPDIVEATNMSGQLYSISDVGQHKVYALSIMLRDYADYYNITSFAEAFDEHSITGNIMICGFDNMEARKVFFKSWLKRVESLPMEDKKKCLYIDGRLKIEEFQVLCIKGDDEYNIKRYAKDFLFDDKEAEVELCSLKQTSYCANMIASYMVNLFVNFCANLCNPRIERDVPFFTNYNAELMYLKTEA